MVHYIFTIRMRKAIECTTTGETEKKSKRAGFPVDRFYESAEHPT